MIKHISLDFWNTLMTSNKEFSNHRLDFLKTKYLPNISIEELNFNIEKIGDESDRINMSEGVSIPSELMYQRLFSQFEISINTNEAKNVYDSLEVFFLSNPPIPLYDLEELKKSLKVLKNKGFTLNISSNTAYIKGSTLRKVFKHYNLLSHFDFLIFSDEINSSKPSYKFFDKLAKDCEEINISKNSILHIGDSYEADIEGAELSKIKSRLIDYKKESLIDLLKKLSN
tara:strand:+ start:1895 stop:2578 length:684 start_codon:yes stop_codon:yes gene_type:complete